MGVEFEGTPQCQEEEDGGAHLDGDGPGVTVVVAGGDVDGPIEDGEHVATVGVGVYGLVVEGREDGRGDLVQAVFVVVEEEVVAGGIEYVEVREEGDEEESDEGGKVEVWGTFEGGVKDGAGGRCGVIFEDGLAEGFV